MAEHSHAWDIHNIITWIGILMILFWALGKSLGWISSPVWVDMIPVYGAAVALAGTSVGVGKALQKLDRVITDVEMNGAQGAAQSSHFQCGVSHPAQPERSDNKDATSL